METLLQDLRYGLRALTKSPGFALTAILSLALGIGANTAIFSVTDALMLRSLPVKDPQRLVLFGQAHASGITDNVPTGSVELFSEPQFRAIRAQNKVFDDVCGMFSMSSMLYTFAPGATAPERIRTRLVTGNYFTTLGVSPAVGRLFTDAADTPPDAHAEAVLSYSWWKRRFGGNPNIVGKTLRIADRSYDIVGVAAPEFFGTIVGESPDAWLPVSMMSAIPPYYNFHDQNLAASLYVTGRLKPAVTTQQASANLNVLFQQLLHAYLGASPSARDLNDIEHARIELTPAANGLSGLRERFSLPLQVLTVVVALVLLIACANVANLLLARATARHREFAIRLAVGSGRVRLIRQLLTECLLLAGAGGLLGVLLASWGSDLLVALSGAVMNVAPNLRVLGFTLGVCVLTALLFGLAPALRATAVDPAPALREGRSGGSARALTGRILVVSQVALSLMLLIGAGLFVRSLTNLENIDTGFRRETIRMAIAVDSIGLRKDDRLTALYRKIEDRVARVPGVEAASFSQFAFAQGETTEDTYVEGHPSKTGRPEEMTVNIAGPSIFTAFGTPIVAGRGFDAHDTAASRKVAVINQIAAKAIFGNDSPIGAHMSLNNRSYDIEIVGVVKDAKYTKLRERPRRLVIVPYTQRREFLHNLMVRTAGAHAPIPEIRQAIREVEPNLPIGDVSTMGYLVDRSLTEQFVLAKLSTFFGVLALLLAAIGLYGILSYSVARRSNEIGIRMALGAQRGRVLGMVLGETLRMMLFGVAIGVPAALLCSRWIESLLFGLKATHAATIAGAVLLLAVIGAVAGLLPARRAARVDPMVALRYE